VIKKHARSYIKEYSFGLMRLFVLRSAQLLIIAFKESLHPPIKPRAIFINTETAISPGSLSSILE
jgi:hypothetical protein